LFTVLAVTSVQVIPVDKTENFDVMYDFLKENWEIARWVALGSVIFEVRTKSNCFTDHKFFNCIRHFIF
jgi:hypothetical protein